MGHRGMDMRAASCCALVSVPGDAMPCPEQRQLPPRSPPSFFYQAVEVGPRRRRPVYSLALTTIHIAVPLSPPRFWLQAVEELLSVLGVDGGLLVRVPSWHYHDPTLGDSTTTMPLHQALLRCFDLRQPKLELLQLLHQKLAMRQQQAAAAALAGVASGKAADGGPAGSIASDLLRSDGSSVANGSTANGSMANGAANGHAAKKNMYAVANGSSVSNGSSPSAAHVDELCGNGCIVDKLDQLAALCGDSEAADRYLEPRHVVDVLEDFCPAALGVGELLGTLRQLAPRLYSISSSQVGARWVGGGGSVVRKGSMVGTGWGNEWVGCKERFHGW